MTGSSRQAGPLGVHRYTSDGYTGLAGQGQGQLDEEWNVRALGEVADNECQQVRKEGAWWGYISLHQCPV